MLGRALNIFAVADLADMGEDEDVKRGEGLVGRTFLSLPTVQWNRSCFLIPFC